MSEHVPTSALPLFAAAASPAPAERAHETAELVHRRYLSKLRDALRREAERTGVPMCADDAHRLMRTTPGLSMPPDMNPNALGTLFRGDRDGNGRARWQMEGYTKSTRAGANDNPIRLWRLVD
jgi:hypothetical protein